MDDKNLMIESMIRQELGGGLPPGFTMEERDGVWSWFHRTPSGQSQQAVGSEVDTKGAAWTVFYRELIGLLPPNYATVQDGQGWVWVLSDDSPRRSFPKAGRGEAMAEAWNDFKAAIIKADRPPHQEAGDDPRAIMARFQQISFQQVGVHLQMEQLEKQERVNIMQLRKLAGDFNTAMAKAVKEAGSGGQG